MNTQTKIFLKDKFKGYYAKTRIPAPAQIEKREFGVGTLERKIAVRHKSYESENELNSYLRRDAPYYISYSTAYYEFPLNQPMSTKNWLGADLVFDIDVDMKFLNNSGMADAKNETRKLINFLTGDFSFSDDELKINFSGSKGYHIHLANPAVLELGKDERREIVDYVSATGLNYKWDSLWKRRVENKSINFIKNSDVSAFQEINGIGKEKAKKIFDKKADLVGQIERMGIGNVEGFSGFRKSLFDKITDEMKVPFQGDTDKSVTADTSKLIRLPDTLHGGTGLIAKRVVYKDFEGFDPLRDAIAFEDEEIKIKIDENYEGKIKFEMNEREFEVKGKYATLPMYAGVYLMLKGVCDVVWVKY